MTSFTFAEEIDFREIKLHGIVGKGSFGTVKKGIWRNLDVAVKVIVTEQEKQAFIVEVKQLSRVNHPNIVKLYGACTRMPVCLIMEYAEGGSLYNVLHCMKEVKYTFAHAMSWLLQCATGVAYLHNMKPRALIHRDLKPPNLLLVNGGTVLKICDFGTACDKHTIMTNSKGSAAWMAPEVFEGSHYSEKCDIFSWAIILWEVLARKKPFHDGEGANAFGIMWAIHRGKRPPLIQDLPKPIEDLMIECWDNNARSRPSMTEVQNRLAVLFEYTSGADVPLTSLQPQTIIAETPPILISEYGNFTASSGYKTVLPFDQQIETSNYSVSVSTKDRLIYQDSMFDTQMKDKKKRLSADFSSTDIRPFSHKGHRRSGSCDSPHLQLLEAPNLSKDNLPSGSAPKLAEDVKDKNSSSENMPIMPPNNSSFFYLEPRLQPIPPVQCKESIDIYEEHMKLAHELLRYRNEISLLTERRNELLRKQQEDQDNTYTYIDEFVRHKRENEHLLELRKNLKKQLEIIRGREGEEWVMVYKDKP